MKFQRSSIAVVSIISIVFLVLVIIVSLSKYDTKSFILNENHFTQTNDKNNSSIEKKIVSPSTLSAPIPYPTPYNKLTYVLDIAHKALVANYDIHVTTDEIRTYLENLLIDATDDDFQKCYIKLDALVAAADSLFTENLTPEEAAKTYLSNQEFSPDGNLSPHIKWLQQIQSYSQVEEMKRMLPLSKKDAIEKSLKGNRETVEMHKLAELILPPEERKGPEIEWNWHLYRQKLLDYAKENLFDSHPELQYLNPDEIFLLPPQIPTLIPQVLKPEH